MPPSSPSPRSRTRPRRHRSRRLAEVDRWLTRSPAQPEHWGRGYATEAARRLLGLCFRDQGLRRVTAQFFSADEASWRLMERVGMRRGHAVRESLHRTGEWLDVLGYALLDHEWRDRAGSG